VSRHTSGLAGHNMGFRLSGEVRPAQEGITRGSDRATYFSVGGSSPLFSKPHFLRATLDS